MSKHRRNRCSYLALAFAAASSAWLAAIAADPESSSTRSVFLAENAAVMQRMMAGMSARTGKSTDADFATMMIAHHQGAIDMAVLELRFGRSEQLRRIAQEIIVDQQQEIIAMRRALGEPLPSPVVAPAQLETTPPPGS